MQSTPSRNSIAPIPDIPFKSEKQVTLNGVNVFINLDANFERLKILVQEQS